MSERNGRSRCQLGLPAHCLFPCYPDRLESLRVGVFDLVSSARRNAIAPTSQPCLDGGPFELMTTLACATVKPYFSASVFGSYVSFQSSIVWTCSLQAKWGRQYQSPPPGGIGDELWNGHSDAGANKASGLAFVPTPWQASYIAPHDRLDLPRTDRRGHVCYGRLPRLPPSSEA